MRRPVKWRYLEKRLNKKPYSYRYLALRSGPYLKFNGVDRRILNSSYCVIFPSMRFEEFLLKNMRELF